MIVRILPEAEEALYQVTGQQGQSEAMARKVEAPGLPGMWLSVSFMKQVY